MMAWKILYIYWRIIGICPFGLKNWRTIRVSDFGFFQSLILSFVFFVCYIQIATNKINFYLKQQTTMNKVSDVVGHTVESMMTITIWISFAIHQKQLRTIQKSFVRVIKACELLGIRETHSRLMNRVHYQVIVATVIWFPFYIVNVIHPPAEMKKFFSVFYCTCHSVLPNFIIIYCAAVTLIRDQFRLLNSKLQEIVEFDVARMSSDQLGRKNESKKAGQANQLMISFFFRQSYADDGQGPCNDILLSYVRIESLIESDSLAFLGRTHTEMVELSRSIVGFLSPSLYSVLMVHLVQLSSIIYSLACAIVTKTFWTSEHWASYMALLWWFYFHMFAMIAETAIADSATEEANRAGDILHEALMVQPSRKCKDAVMIWSMRLLQEPMTMDLFGIIQMKYSVVYKILGLTVAYTTLLIQMDD